VVRLVPPFNGRHVGGHLRSCRGPRVDGRGVDAEQRTSSGAGSGVSTERARAPASPPLDQRSKLHPVRPMSAVSGFLCLRVLVETMGAATAGAAARSNCRIARTKRGSRRSARTATGGAPRRRAAAFDLEKSPCKAGASAEQPKTAEPDSAAFLSESVRRAGNRIEAGRASAHRRGDRSAAACGGCERPCSGDVPPSLERRNEEPRGPAAPICRLGAPRRPRA